VESTGWVIGRLPTRPEQIGVAGTSGSRFGAADSQEEKVKLFKEFRDFITRGNLIDLAVAFIIAAAFGAIVTALVDKVLMPLIAAIAGQPNFDALTVTVHNAVIPYGTFITAVVNFLLIAAAVFFFIVKPYNMWRARQDKAKEVSPAAPAEPPEEIVLLRQIRDQLTVTNR
jgi:large conductance mechanosensitive channel